MGNKNSIGNNTINDRNRIIEILRSHGQDYEVIWQKLLSVNMKLFYPRVRNDVQFRQQSEENYSNITSTYGHENLDGITFDMFQNYIIIRYFPIEHITTENNSKIKREYEILRDIYNNLKGKHLIRYVVKRLFGMETNQNRNASLKSIMDITYDLMMAFYFDLLKTYNFGAIEKHITKNKYKIGDILIKKLLHQMASCLVFSFAKGLPDIGQYYQAQDINNNPQIKKLIKLVSPVEKLQFIETLNEQEKNMPIVKEQTKFANEHLFQPQK